MHPQPTESTSLLPTFKTNDELKSGQVDAAGRTNPSSSWRSVTRVGSIVLLIVVWIGLVVSIHANIRENDSTGSASAAAAAADTSAAGTSWWELNKDKYLKNYSAFWDEKKAWFETSWNKTKEEFDDFKNSTISAMGGANLSLAEQSLWWEEHKKYFSSWWKTNYTALYEDKFKNYSEFWDDKKASIQEQWNQTKSDFADLANTTETTYEHTKEYLFDDNGTAVDGYEVKSETVSNGDGTVTRSEEYTDVNGTTTSSSSTSSAVVRKASKKHDEN